MGMVSDMYINCCPACSSPSGAQSPLRSPPPSVHLTGFCMRWGTSPTSEVFWPLTLPRATRLASPGRPSLVPREKQDATPWVQGPTSCWAPPCSDFYMQAQPREPTCVSALVTPTWPFVPVGASWWSCSMTYEVEQFFWSTLPPALIGLTDKCPHFKWQYRSRCPWSSGPCISSRALSAQTGLWGSLPPRQCRGRPPGDSPLACRPHDVFSALAHSGGPAAHGGDRSPNVTLTPWKSGNSTVARQSISPLDAFPASRGRGNWQARGRRAFFPPPVFCQEFEMRWSLPDWDDRVPQKSASKLEVTGRPAPTWLSKVRDSGLGAKHDLATERYKQCVLRRSLGQTWAALWRPAPTVLLFKTV